MQPNRLLQIIGVLLMATSAAGAAAVFAGPAVAPHGPTLHTYTFTWNVTSITASFDGRTPDGQTVDTTLHNGFVNIIRVEFNFTGTYSPPPARPRSTAQVTIAITDPGGNETGGSAQATSSTPAMIVAQVEYDGPPGNWSVKAKSIEEAFKKLTERFPPSTAGQGDWPITVQSQRGGSPCPLTCSFASGSLNWQFDVTAWVYEPVLVSPVPGAKKG